MRAEQAVNIDDIRGVQLVDLSAGFDATINNASVSGAPVTDWRAPVSWMWSRFARAAPRATTASTCAASAIEG